MTETDECRALGVHLSSVDEDGYCLHCGHSPDDDVDEGEDLGWTGL